MRRVAPRWARRAVAGDRAGQAVPPRLRVGNLDDRDPDAIREMLPGMLGHQRGFRPDVRGLHHIPARASTDRRNHTGGILSLPEVLISQLAVTRTSVRSARSINCPPHGASLAARPDGAAFGTVEADPENG